jgi:hypothetical protein
VVTCELVAGWTVVSACGGCSSEADCMADPTCRWLVPADERSSQGAEKGPPRHRMRWFCHFSPPAPLTS